MWIELRFPAGRYHATPWGRHVNEGAIEWPPSPWRLCRALLATGFNRAGWTEPPAGAVSLLERLATADPVYHLPVATSAHTRHYMPDFQGDTSRVIDAFALPAGPAYIEWDVTLDAGMEVLLRGLLRQMPYLGRAESWVEADLVTGPTGSLQRCFPSAHQPSPDMERIALLSPMKSEDYRVWRESAWRGDASARLNELAERKGSAPAALPAADQRRLDRLYPATLVDSMRADTAMLQAEGWSQPPGSRWVTYWRSENALSSLSIGARGHESGTRSDTALLALASTARRSTVLPPASTAIRRAAALHAALVKASDTDAGPSPVFTARQKGDPLRGHRHATLMPLDLDGDRRIDHVLVHAPMGFDQGAKTALRRVSRTYAKDLPPLQVLLMGIGRKGDFERSIPGLGSERVWVSSTPFFAPRHLKPRGKSSLTGQIHAELLERGFPEPTSIEVEVRAGDGPGYVPATDFWNIWRRRTGPRLTDRWRRYVRSRETGHDSDIPSQPSLGLRITFGSQIRGPLTLGHGSHFGLGQFVPSSA